MDHIKEYKEYLIGNSEFPYIFVYCYNDDNYYIGVFDYNKEPVINEFLLKNFGIESSDIIIKVIKKVPKYFNFLSRPNSEEFITVNGYDLKMGNTEVKPLNPKKKSPINIRIKINTLFGIEQVFDFSGPKKIDEISFTNKKEGKLSPNQIWFLNEKIKGSWEVNSKTGLVDIKGSFSIEGERRSDFMDIEFGKIDGDFSCERNNFISLEGFPREVNGLLNVRENRIKNFEGSTVIKCKEIILDQNELETLEGCPEGVEYLDVDTNNLTTLKGCPGTVTRIECYNNELVDLEGCPKNLPGGLMVSRNNIRSLKGFPDRVGRSLYLDDNELTSLEEMVDRVDPETEVSIGTQCKDDELSEVLEQIWLKMRNSAGTPYHGILTSMEKSIPKHIWEKLDKSSMDSLGDKTKRGFRLLGTRGHIKIIL